MFAKQILIISLLIVFSNAGVIKKELTEIENFHFCLITHLDSINLINFTMNNNVMTQSAKDPKMCENFHDQLFSTISIMYKIMRAELEKAFEDPDEANCLIDVFQKTRFMEYNVIATAAVQFHSNAYKNLKDILDISKNIFIYSTVKCLISEDILFDIFRQLSSRLTVKEDELQCIFDDVKQRQLINASDIFIYDIDEFFNAKFNTKDVLQNFADYQKFDTDLNIKEFKRIVSDFNESKIYESRTQEIVNEDNTTPIDYEIQTQMYIENGELQRNDENHDLFTDYFLIESSTQNIFSDINYDKSYMESDENLSINESIFKSDEIKEIRQKEEYLQETTENLQLSEEVSFESTQVSITVTENFSKKEEENIIDMSITTTNNQNILITTENFKTQNQDFSTINYNEEETVTENIKEFLTSPKNLAKISNTISEIIFETQKLFTKTNKDSENQKLVTIKGFEETTFKDEFNFNYQDETTKLDDQATTNYTPESSSINIKYTHSIRDIYKKLTNRNESQSEEIEIDEIEISSEQSIENFKKSMQKSKLLIKIPDSRIKRTTQECQSKLAKIEMRMKIFKLESINDELNDCISSKMTNENIDDMLVFIILKKSGETESQINLRNKKLMNILIGFVEKIIDCTDLFGFWEMAGFST
ncbi:hypothetical protein PVAND_014410 [Polypedilum vanderplanki]|uniref:Uncharacterized protein n=1 Tax=Polypedilum vanderplanki TaxID=319348 RepID=A0A9J6B9L3_POLVA|nr:hypothetical protein PVAND_014410 [Polypedilum vanderplanki]